MKKKVLCIFVLVFWLVGACTFLSIKVEEQMIPQVTTVSPTDGRGMDASATLPGDCLMEDEYGMPRLYNTYEGTGWEAGTRANEVQSGYEYDWENNVLKMDNGWGTYIQYSSKPLRQGELVEVVRGTSAGEGRWLAVFPEGEKPEISELPEGVTIEEESDRVIQFLVEKNVEPFMEARTKSIVPELYGAKVYGFTDMGELLDNFTGLGLLLLILTATLTLWIFTCVLSKNAGKNRWFLVANLVIGLVLLICVPLALKTIDLPSSLLPREQITDISYFAQEMEDFFGGLQSFGNGTPATQAGVDMLKAQKEAALRPLLFLAGGVVLAGVIAAVEWLLIRRRRRPKAE